jgi:hypothetical protein
MRIFAIAETGGEGRVRAFSSAVLAMAAASASEGCALEAPPEDMDSVLAGASGVPRASEVAGTPATVWLVCCGDGGCTNGFLGAFTDKATADAAAAAAQKTDKMGLSYYSLEAHVK